MRWLFGLALLSIAFAQEPRPSPFVIGAGGGGGVPTSLPIGVSITSGTTCGQLFQTGSLLDQDAANNCYVKTALSTPSAPTVTTHGTAGVTSYTYAYQTVNLLGPSDVGTETTIATGNATLDATNYNIVTPTCAAGLKAYIWRIHSAGTPSSVGILVSDAIGQPVLFDCAVATNDVGLSSTGSDTPNLPLNQTRGLYVHYGIRSGPQDFADVTGTTSPINQTPNRFLYNVVPTQNGAGQNTQAFNLTLLTNYDPGVVDPRTDIVGGLISEVIGYRKPGVGGFGNIEADTYYYGEQGLDSINLYSGFGVIQARDGTGPIVVGSVVDYQARDVVVQAGATLTNLIGFDTDNLTAGGTLNIGFRSQVSSGSGKWAFYGSGTAASFFGGTVQANGYMSADGTTGATVTTCTGFKNGLCISGT